MSDISQHSETLALHAGSHRRDPATNSVAVPIYQTTSYQFDSTEHASKLFALQELGDMLAFIMLTAQVSYRMAYNQSFYIRFSQLLVFTQQS